MPRTLTLILLLALLNVQPKLPVVQPTLSVAQPTLPVVQPKLPVVPQADLRMPAALDEYPTPGCGYNPTIDAILEEVTLSGWSGWVRQLSGAEPVSVGGNPLTIHTRYSPALFGLSLSGERSPAYDFILEQVTGWYPQEQIQEHHYQTTFGGTPQTWKNLVLTIPGSKWAEEEVLLIAHLDGTSPQPLSLAPGADDNASGSAALLEAARALQDTALPRTLRLIWFSGEEQWMRGSKAYASSHDLSQVLGVINVDMIGYDADDDHCFELHVGTLPASERVGNCFVQAVEAYQPDLLYEYKTSSASWASDHGSFWQAGVGAVLALENYTYDTAPDRCPGAKNPDRNPYYHQTTDTYDKLNLPYGFALARASLASALSLANTPKYFVLFPMVKSDFNP